MNSQDNLILSLDVSDGELALDLADRLRDWVSMVRVGPDLLLNAGVDVVDNLRANGHRVMLDLALQDLPEHIAVATRAASRRGVRMVTLQAQGGQVMLRAALTSLSDLTLIPGQELLGVVARTIPELPEALREDDAAREHAIERGFDLASLAIDAGVYGVMVPRFALRDLRQKLGPEPTLFCALDDDDSNPRPSQLIMDGANHIIIGESVTRARDPIAAIRAHYEEVCELPA